MQHAVAHTTTHTHSTCSWDSGRMLQQSYYGCGDGSCWAGRTPWRWNPGEYKPRHFSINRSLTGKLQTVPIQQQPERSLARHHKHRHPPPTHTSFHWHCETIKPTHSSMRLLGEPALAPDRGAHQRHTNPHDRDAPQLVGAQRIYYVMRGELQQPGHFSKASCLCPDSNDSHRNSNMHLNRQGQSGAP